MGGICSADPEATVGALLAWAAALSLLVGAVAALAIKVLQNARDVQAAWRKLREHDAALNGAAVAPRRDGEA